MNYIENYYNNVIKYDLVNKFYYTKLNKIPKIRKITITFGFKESTVKQLSTTLLALELITSKKGQLIVAKKENLSLKIKKGFPVGCKIVLQKKAICNYLSKLIDGVLYKIKILLKAINIKTKHNNVVSYKLNDTSLFIEIEQNYSLFNSILTNIRIVVACKKVNQKGFIFLIKSLKQPLN